MRALVDEDGQFGKPRLRLVEAGTDDLEPAEVLRPATRLFHDLMQILRLCLPAAFDPKTTSAGVLGLLARAADLPDFPALQAHVVETQRQVRECFVRILGKAPGR